MKNWYVLMIKSGKETHVDTRLKYKKYNSYLPMVKVDKRERPHARRDIEPMFPGYLFIKLDAGVDDFHPIKREPDVTGFIEMDYRHDTGRLCAFPSVLAPELIVLFRSIEDRDGVYTGEKIRFNSGDEVRAISGMFKDYEGVVKSILSRNGVERSLVLFKTLSGSLSVEMDEREIVLN